ncbi:MAG: hypothetical protein JWN40_5318 [Phycisphaerales bacterium]|nr:hypothetical protein [Phycisphaerales bacterium]
MSWQAIPEHLAWITAVVGSMAIVGLWLLKRGRWPRRRGNGRFCRRCEYDLSGLTSARCPECGTELSERNVATGERRRRAGLALTGAMLLIISLAGLGTVWWGPLKQVDWYRYKLSRWVAADLRSTDEDLVERAWNELERRRAEGPLSDAVEYIASEAALAEQAKAEDQHGALEEKLVNYLTHRAAARRLDAGQMDRFFRQANSVEVLVRPVVVRGEDAEFGMRATGSGPVSGMRVPPPPDDAGKNWHCDVHVGSLKVGNEYPDMGSGTGCEGVRFPGRHTMTWRCSTVGRQEVSFIRRVHLFRTPTGEGGPQDEFATFEETYRATFLVEATPGPDNPRLVRNPELAASIAAAYWQVQFPHRGERGGTVFVSFSRPPENIAFDVTLRVGGEEIRLSDSSVTCRKGKLGGGGASLGQPWMPSADTADVILRSSGAVARRTPDIFEIWDGEIVIRDVPIPK